MVVRHATILLALLSFSTTSAQACRFFEAYDGAVGSIYRLEANPPDRPGVEFTVLEGEAFYECFTRSIGIGIHTREAICQRDDGSTVETGITWVQFENNAMLSAAVFRGYVYYPACE